MNPGDTCTPVYGLPYATGTSRPCNIGSTGCDFAEAVEEQLDALDTIVDGFSSIPFAYASNIAEMQFNNAVPGFFVPFFDTTLADTDNMLDLSLDSTSIMIQTPGVYSFFGDVEISVPITATGATVELRVFNATGSQVDGALFNILSLTASTSMPLRTDGTRTANVATTVELEVNVDVGYSCSFALGISGPLGLVSFVQTFRAGAIWLRSPL